MRDGDDSDAPVEGSRQGQSQHMGERDSRGRFISGNSGGGRREGARNRLSSSFLAAVEADFAEHGAETLERVRTQDPVAYLRIVGALVSRISDNEAAENQPQNNVMIVVDYGTEANWERNAIEHQRGLVDEASRV